MITPSVQIIGRMLALSVTALVLGFTYNRVSPLGIATHHPPAQQTVATGQPVSPVAQTLPQMQPFAVLPQTPGVGTAPLVAGTQETFPVQPPPNVMTPMQPPPGTMTPVQPPPGTISPVQLPPGAMAPVQLPPSNNTVVPVQPPPPAGTVQPTRITPPANGVKPPTRPPAHPPQQPHQPVRPPSHPPSVQPVQPPATPPATKVEPNLINWENAQVMMATQGALLIDGRPPSYFQAGTIPGAISLPCNNLAAVIGDFQQRVPKEASLIVFCMDAECEVSQHCAQVLMKDYGYQHVYYLAGGYVAWQRFEATRPAPSPEESAP